MTDTLHPTWFSPQPPGDALPRRLPSPFATPPHALAQRAALELQDFLRRGGLPLATGTGKMFGVLVVTCRQGRVGYLRGFSGLIDDRADVPGFVPGTWDSAAKDRIWAQQADGLRELSRQVDLLVTGAEAEARARLASLERHRDETLAALRTHHRARKDARKQERAALAAGAPENAQRLAALETESRADQAEGKARRRAFDEEKRTLEAALAAITARRRALEVERQRRCTETLHAVQDTYVMRNAAGQRRRLREIFAPKEVPGGAGECAAPKLLSHAFALGVTPVALAEFWWGAPPLAGDRRPGHFYPACRGKCGILLPFMLQGLDVEPAPLPGMVPVADDEPPIIYEDDDLLVVDKPCGLLSIPGRHRNLRDSVYLRLKQRHPALSGPLLVHRLDLDTSGVLLIAKRPEVHRELQQLFLERKVEKHYIAWIEGCPRHDEGIIDLPMRVDLMDRPRQLHDPVHGKPAVTHFRVLAREGGRSRVALQPLTGRTHQLRLHAAHPAGLDAPIVGDRLYGQAGPRMMLHAESLRLCHPRTGEVLFVERKAPF